MRDRYIPPPLQPGDKCWLLRGVLLYEVVVSEVRICLEGDRLEFTMHRIEMEHDVEKYIAGEFHHRSDLFLRPAERKQLVEEIESRVESLEYLKKDLEDEEEMEAEHG